MSVAFVTNIRNGNITKIGDRNIIMILNAQYPLDGDCILHYLLTRSNFPFFLRLALSWVVKTKFCIFSDDSFPKLSNLVYLNF